MNGKLKICENCKHFVNGTSECRRYPPHPAGDAFTPQRWPIMKRGQWCGEYEELK